MHKTLLPTKYGWLRLFLATLCLGFLVCSTLLAQVNSGGTATTANHPKQIIGYLTNWDAWKSTAQGMPGPGALTHLNIDYSKFTILNFSFLGVAKDGSLHGGDYRNKQIYQPGAVQEPAPLLNGSVYDSWDMHLIYGELEYKWDFTDPATQAAGFVADGQGWKNTITGLSGPMPVPLSKPGGAKGLIALAHEKGVKVMASIGGWSMCKHFPEMAADPVKRARFINDCKKLMAIGFDGIDLDWEYPGPFAGMNFTGSQADFANFTTLVQEIRQAIGSGKLITAAFSATPAKIQGFQWTTLASLMNYFNMMTYDFNGGWSNKAGHNAPLYDYPGAEATNNSFDATYRALAAAGVPASKITMGVPLYGRGVITNGPAAVNAPTVKSPRTVDPDGPISTAADYANWGAYDGTPSYEYIRQNKTGWTEGWDDNAKVPYLTKGNYFLSYDNEQSVGFKAQYVVDKGLAGVILWTCFGDLQVGGTATNSGTKLVRYSNVSSPLTNKINAVFAAGNTGMPTVSITAPASGTSYATGASVTVTATAADPGGSIAKVEFFRNGTLFATDLTSPYSAAIASLPAGNHTLTAKATDNQGNTATSATVSISASTTTNTPPTVSLTAPTNGASFPAGSTITLTANASDADGTVSKVEFFQGSTKLGEDATSPYSFTWANVAAGSYTLTAKATDNQAASTTSAAVSISVTVTNPCASTFRVVGYMPSWQGSVSSIQYSKLTHINYSFILPNSDGTLQALPEPAKLQSLVTNAHAQGVKVLIAVGGYNDGNDQGFVNLSKTAATRATFVNALKALVQQYNLDGVDIDWEYPEPDRGTESQNFTSLMHDLSVAFHAQGKLVTAAVVSLGYNANGVANAVFADVDFLNIMAYDGGDGELHSPYSYAVQALDYWLNRGLPASKAVLGVPFYGRPSWKGYNTLLSEGANPNSDIFNGVYYNGIPTIKQKTQLAKTRASGIMIWELSFDATGANSLLSAIDQQAGGGCNGTGNPDVSFSNPTDGATLAVGVPVTLTATATDNGSVASVFFKVNNGANIATTRSGSVYTASWTPTTAGSYTISVTAKDNENNTTTRQITVTASSCTAAAWEPTKVYVKDNEVSYNGRRYRAKWWTQNENPATRSGQWDVWIDLGPCGAAARTIGAALATESFLIRAYPNPFGSVTTLEVQLTQPEAIFFEVYDRTGALKKTMTFQATAAGIHTIDLSTDLLATGLYLLKARTSTQTSTLRLMKR